ncbi:GDSL-type esterase/lipase family protein [Sodalinema gerasimenkoae]|uniref:GDSL-type esterase/lipase family protein n=1 Tax=Sodalinema gerasimenkoae TaxID=2862348 RepID=UPI00135772AF|nr:GDSL-type esterase/lipase family protein [Sodalinema gerasimenkoae]
MNPLSLALMLGTLPLLAQVMPPSLPHLLSGEAVVSEAGTAPTPPEIAIARRVPNTTAQLYQQRLAALDAGRLYTRLPRHSFQEVWETARENPTYEQWTALLWEEAKATAAGQADNRLCVTIGDSLTQWLPPGIFVGDRLWLNQGISGDNTARIRRRIGLLEGTRPSTIFLMAGVNDLIAGRSVQEVLFNQQDIIHQLRSRYPQAQVVVQSILPTDHQAVSNEDIRAVNRELAQIARRQGAVFLDLYPHFSDEVGRMRGEFSTDGIHLSDRGYELWQTFLQQMEDQLARDPSALNRI